MGFISRHPSGPESRLTGACASFLCKKLTVLEDTGCQQSEHAHSFQHKQLHTGGLTAFIYPLIPLLRSEEPAVQAGGRRAAERPAALRRPEPAANE